MIVGQAATGESETRRWLWFLLRRLAYLVVGVFVLSSVVFLALRVVPGDPAQRVAGLHTTPEHVEALRQEMRLDQPLARQYRDHLVSIASLDFGDSFATGRPVVETISTRLPATVQLAATSIAVIMTVSIIAGLAMASWTSKHPSGRGDRVFTAATGLGASMPEFLASTYLVLLFAVALRWLPAGGNDGISALVLPVLAISIRPIALLSRVVRAEALTVLEQDYVRVARSKRLPALTLYLRHVLPNVLTGSLTIGGVLFAALLGGTVVVENVFAWPGLGSAVVNAVLARDYPVVQAVVVILGAAVIVINAVVDVVLALTDRRSLVAES